jgi:hypothetical protein
VTRHVLSASIDFYAGDDSRVGDDPDKGSAIRLPLADRLVVEDRAADAFTETGRGYDQLAIGTPGFFGLGNPQSGKSSVAGRSALIHRQQALVIGD